MSSIPTIAIIALYAFIFVSGLVNALYPKLMWGIFESWKAVKEPPKEFFIVRRISGIVVMILITAIALFPYIMRIR